MIMKSRRILAVLAACTAVTFTGCGVVTVVPIGEEASYTGKFLKPLLEEGLSM